jgi:integrase
MYKNTMKTAYRMFKRKDRPNYYIQNNSTREQHCLGTSDKIQAKRLLDAKNQENQSAALNLQLGKTYIAHADPKMATRIWQEAINELCTHGKEVSQKRCTRAFDSTAFDIIRNKSIVGTTSDDLKVVLRRGGAIANHYLRRLHNIALGNGWIQWHIIPPKQWPKAEKQPKRAITIDEHQKIIGAEKNNEERRQYYEMLWLVGAAQTDCALLTAENINWETLILSYERSKTGQMAFLRIGKSLQALLEKLPKLGFLFPKIAATNNKDRSAEFYRRCRLLGIKGISLHSYRYAWAERAYTQGYEQRYAQAALGHKNKAVHDAYAKRAVVICPPLENVEELTARLVPKEEQIVEETIGLSA